MKTPLACVAVSASASVWALPRFNRADSIFGVSIRRFTSASAGDSEQYIALVRHYRGESSVVEAPFAFRPLAPWAASHLPSDPMTSLNVVALFAIFVATACVFATALRIHRRISAAVVAGLFFGLSFPVFYYGAIGQVDVVSIALCCGAVALAVHDRLLPSIAVFFLAMLTKETSIAIAPFLLLWEFQRSRARAAALLVGLSLASMSAFLLTHRVFAPPVPNAYSWAPNLAELRVNLMRPRVYATFFLGLGVQGAIFLATPQRRWLEPWTAGLLTSVALFVFALTTAWADARFLWTGQIFTSVIAAGWVSRRLLQRFAVERIA